MIVATRYPRRPWDAPGGASRKPVASIAAGVLLACSWAVLPGCRGTDDAVSTPSVPAAENPVQVVRRAVPAMGTMFTIMLTDGEDEEKSRSAVEAAFDEVRRVEALMTTYRDAAPLSRLNAAAGAPLIMPAEIIELLTEANRISERTGGKFDVSFASMGDLWRFKEDPPKLPDPEAIRKRLPLIDHNQILIDEGRGTVRLGRPGMRISLGAIAKGYGVDRAGAVLRKHGIDDFIVYGGGDILFSGKKGTKPWSVGVQDPRNHQAYFARFELPGTKAVVTSGDYEKFFVLGGTRYHHIIDPDTGYPARGTVSVTVMADSTMVADAFATGIFVLGPEQGMALIEADPTLEGIIVDDRLRPHVSSGLRKRVTLTPISNPPETAER